MSAVTRCPECGTAFRVTPGQLGARAGQVRCGRCGSAFDATSNLVADAGMSESERSTGRPSEIRQGARHAVPFPADTSEIRADAPPGWDFERPGSQRPSTMWGAAAAIALLALGAQFGFHFRGEIALLWPDSKPILTLACARLGCDIPLPRRVEQMSIEASDLQAEGSSPSIMVLSATLRNRAAFPQQFPALELTLTDAQELPVARRVLTARDYVGRTGKLENGFAANSELTVKVFIETSSLKPTGYRLYLFYP